MSDENEISYEEMDEKEGEELSPKDKIKKLHDELKACQAEKQTYLEGWQRSKADFVNARKIEERERAEFAKFAAERLIKEVIDVLDTFEMAWSHKESWEKVDKNWRIGVESIHSKLEETLKRHGLKPIIPKEADPFDPNLHQSVTATPTPDKSKDDTIVQVIQRGYELEGKVLRPAKVVIAHYE